MSCIEAIIDFLLPIISLSNQQSLDCHLKHISGLAMFLNLDECVFRWYGISLEIFRLY